MTKPLPHEVAERLIILKYQVVRSWAIPPQEIIHGAYPRWSRKEKREFRKVFKEESNQLTKSMKSLRLWQHMTQEERSFISSSVLKINPQHHRNAMWRLESVVAFMWAMKLVEEFPPFDTQFEGELLQKLPYENIVEFFDAAVLHPEDVIEEKRSLAELWHWRSRTRELIEMNGEPPEELGFSSFDEIVQKVAKQAYEHGELPEIVNNDFSAKGKAYRDLSDEEWSDVKSITVERHYALNWLCGYAPDNKWDQTPTDT
jgi:hypothetical protein